MTHQDTCKTCRYHQGFHYCQRKAPVQGEATKWPMTSGDEWCGEHEPIKAETKTYRTMQWMTEPHQIYTPGPDMPALYYDEECIVPASIPVVADSYGNWPELWQRSYTTLVKPSPPFPYQDNCPTLAHVSAAIDARQPDTLSPDEAQQAHKLGMT